MFYAHIVLAKKGPLARIWLAAHWDKKLTKAHVFETNIEQSIEGIMQPKVKLALRTSGHLLLGVVRIYSRKAKYLLADCNEAFVKIKMAFRPGAVDLPEEHREAAVNTITLPEVFHDFDTALPELNDVDIEAQFSINQSRADEITMREDYGSLQMNIQDDGFGDMGFEADTPDIVRDGLENTIEDNFFTGSLVENIDLRSSKVAVAGSSKVLDGTLDEFSNTFESEPAAGLFEGDIFGEPPLQTNSVLEITDKPDESEEDDDDGHFDGGAPSPIPSSDNSRTGTPNLVEPLSSPLLNDKDSHEYPSRKIYEAENLNVQSDVLPMQDTNDSTGINMNDEESFALAPIDSTIIRGFSSKSKRKRKLIVDEIKNISGDEMKNQLANTSDIVTTLDLAPPTKRLMFWKETGGVEKLFALPSRDFCAVHLFKFYQRHLVTIPTSVEDFSNLGSVDILVVEKSNTESLSSPTAKKKKRTLKTIDQEPISQFDMINDSLDKEISKNILSNQVLEQNKINIVQDEFEILNHSTKISDNVHDENNLMQGNFTPSGLDHGDLTPNHCIEHIESIPNLHVDQVSSILNASAIENFSEYDQHSPSHVTDKITHDWDTDYDYPQSVEQIMEEQGIDETTEQFEERVLNKRAAQLFVSVRQALNKKENLTINNLTFKNNRKQAAQKFYSLLVLKKFQVLSIHQQAPYSNITISKGTFFDNPKL